MTKPALLLDTNVWHEYEMGTQPEHGSSELVLWAAAHNVRLGIAAHSLKDLFSLIERDLKRLNEKDQRIDPQKCGAAARAAAWGVVSQLAENVEIVGSDYADAHLAIKYRELHDFYEDNLVIAAFERMNANVLVTNDQKLLKHAPVLTMNPADALKWLRIKLGE